MLCVVNLKIRWSHHAFTVVKTWSQITIELDHDGVRSQWSQEATGTAGTMQQGPRTPNLRCSSSHHLGLWLGPWERGRGWCPQSRATSGSPASLRGNAGQIWPNWSHQPQGRECWREGVGWKEWSLSKECCSNEFV